jgi:hypothetical protein
MPYYWEMWTRIRRPFDRFQPRAQYINPWRWRVAVISLPTIVPAQWRINWSKGRVTRRVLADALREAALPAGLKLVASHHPLVDADTHGTGSTRGGRAALNALAAAGWMRCSRAMCMTRLT